MGMRRSSGSRSVVTAAAELPSFGRPDLECRTAKPRWLMPKLGSVPLYGDTDLVPYPKQPIARGLPRPRGGSDRPSYATRAWSSGSRDAS